MRRGIAAAVVAALMGAACTSTPPTPPNSALASPAADSSSAAPSEALGTEGLPVPTQASPPTSYDLIAAALTAGRIDEPTALEYRVFALFGDSRLPSEFQGAPDPVVDSAALEDARDELADLPPAIAAAVKPYTVRPNDPESIFSSLKLAPAASPTAGGPILLAASRLGPKVALEVAPCFQGWTTVPSLKHHFEVWARCADGWTDADPALLGDLDTIVTMVDQTWAQESAFMEIQPLADQPGQPIINDSDWIDVYLLGREEGVVGGRNLYLDPTFDAAARQDLTSDPTAKYGTSGFLLLDRNRLAVPDEFRADVIHEFFHLLEYARNADAAIQARWFAEASAEWAVTRFQPERADVIHNFWFPKFVQHPEVSLSDDSNRHDYADYIWPFFMQEQFGDKSIAKVWSDLGKVAGSNGNVLAAIDQEIGGFSAVFRDFVVRNLNIDLAPADPDAPAKPLHQKWVTLGTFPGNFPPDYNSADTQNLAPTDAAHPFVDSIASLSAHYYRFVVPPEADKQIGQVVFDFSQFGPHDAFDVDALVAIKDSSNPAGVGWERRREATPPDQLRFCRNDPKNDVEAMYLILTNHDKDPNTKVGDSFKVFSPGTPCAAGQITYHQITTETPAGSGGWSSVEDDTLTIQLNLVFKDGKIVNDGGSWTFTGRRDGSNPVQGGGCPCTVHETDSGSGTWVENAEPSEGIGQITLYVDNGVPTLFGWVVPHYHEVDAGTNGTQTYDRPFDVPWLFTIRGHPIDPNGGPYDMSSVLDYLDVSHAQVHVESSGTIVAPSP